MDIFEKVLGDLSNMVWGPAMLFFLFGTHIFLTFRLKFIQRYTFHAIKLSFEKSHEGEGDVSHFGALTTALAATVGTGNIVGVATAIAAGGPGAVLWMWLTGVFGIATKYAEALLSVKFRVTNKKGQMAGGPMYVLERGMKNKGLAIAFAFFTAIAAFGIGNMVQANSIASLVKETFHIAPWVTGVTITLFTGFVILGGITSIARMCEKFVPFMMVFYILGCVILLLMKWHTVPHTIGLIFTSAFTGQAAFGGFLGTGMKEAMRFGIARGLFSNEAGMGSAPIVAAAAKTSNPVRQALVSSTGVFWDTVVLCALTGLVLVNSGLWMQGLKGAALTKAAFSELTFIGPIVLTIGLFTFVLSTILGWSYYGEKAVEYLWGHRAITTYRYLWVGAVMVGSVVTLPMVWSFADIANALMAIPNLVALWALNDILVDETRKHLWYNLALKKVRG
ncbi:MAG: sodium:alanine symporter family protein [Candidatus Omnitrophota bacterium]